MPVVDNISRFRPQLTSSLQRGVVYTHIKNSFKLHERHSEGLQKRLQCYEIPLTNRNIEKLLQGSDKGFKSFYNEGGVLGRVCFFTVVLDDEVQLALLIRINRLYSKDRKPTSRKLLSALEMLCIKAATPWGTT